MRNNLLIIFSLKCFVEQKKICPYDFMCFNRLAAYIFGNCLIISDDYLHKIFLSRWVTVYNICKMLIDLIVFEVLVFLILHSAKTKSIQWTYFFIPIFGNDQSPTFYFYQVVVVSPSNIWVLVETIVQYGCGYILLIYIADIINNL